MFDSHLHTRFSTDSMMVITEALKKAEELNIGLVITEHMDIDYPVPEKFIFDKDAYFNEYSKYRNDKLLLGVELGLKTNCVEENRALTEKYPFDFVLGSVHLVDNMDLFGDEFYKGKTKHEAYTRYLEYMLECLKEHDFIDSLGHIDYITRYARYGDTEMYYKEFADYIDEVLRLAAHRGISLEINTRRFENEKAVKNLETIYKRFYELGGRTVTTGSDAHIKSYVGRNIKDAFEMAERCNLKPVYFKERKPEYMK